MPNEIIEANYEVVYERTLEVIATEIRTIDNHICRAALSGAIEIGARLHEAKERVGHGNWEDWCKENLNYSKSQAERFMKISTEYGKEGSLYLGAISKTYTCTDLSISKAFKLLSVPEEAVEAFIESHDVGSMSVRDLEDEIKALKEEVAAHKAKAVASEGLERELADVREKLEIEASAAAKAEAAQRAAETAKIEAEGRLKAAKAKEKQTINKALEKAVEDAKVIAAKENEKETEALRTELSAAQKRLNLMTNEDIARFKVKVDDMQKAYSDALSCIDEIRKTDQEYAETMRAAVKKLLGMLAGQV